MAAKTVPLAKCLPQKTVSSSPGYKNRLENVSSSTHDSAEQLKLWWLAIALPQFHSAHKDKCIVFPIAFWKKSTESSSTENMGNAAEVQFAKKEMEGL